MYRLQYKRDIWTAIDTVDAILNKKENESNASIMNLTSAKIKSMKNNILQKLQLSFLENLIEE